MKNYWVKKNKSNGRFVRTRTPWTPSRWNNGHVDKKGRFRVYRPDCPRAGKDGYCFRAHVVYWLHNGFVHPRNRELHHKDENKLNDKIGNLIPLTHSEHRRIHQENWVFIKCKGCGKPFREHAWRVASRNVKFCGQKCFHSFPKSKSHRDKISKRLKAAYRSGKRKPMRGKRIKK
jgi:hypothetical protein